jgi:hypothetical protein
MKKDFEMDERSFFGKREIGEDIPEYEYTDKNSDRVLKLYIRKIKQDLKDVMSIDFLLDASSDLQEHKENIENITQDKEIIRAFDYLARSFEKNYQELNKDIHFFKMQLKSKKITL